MLLLIPFLYGSFVAALSSPPDNDASLNNPRSPRLKGGQPMTRDLNPDQAHYSTGEPLLNVSLGLSTSVHQAARSIGDFEADVRSDSHLSARMDRMDDRLNNLANCFEHNGIEDVLLDGTTQYEEFKDSWNWNTAFPAHPRAIVYAEDVREVRVAVRCATILQYPVQALAGGHSWAMFSIGHGEPGVVIAVRYLDGIEYDSTDDTVTVGGGVLLGNLAIFLHNRGRAISHGDCLTVGIAGHSLHGGMGQTSRMWGLSTDFIIGMDVVIAGGHMKHASETENPDLFHAMKGAGSSFGIAVGLKLRTVPIPEKIVRFDFHADCVNGAGAARSFVAFQKCVQSEQFSKNTGLMISFDQKENSPEIRFAVGGFHFAEISHVTNVIRPCFLQAIHEHGTIVEDQSAYTNYEVMLVNMAADEDELTGEVPYYGELDPSPSVFKSIIVPEDNPVNEKQVEELLDAMTEASKYSFDHLYFRLLGGTGSQVPLATDTAVSSRSALWAVEMGLNSNSDAAIAFGDRVLGTLIDPAAQQTYHGFTSFLDGTLSRDKAQSTYYSSEEIKKLREIKAKYDPKQVFRNPHSFQPQEP